MSDEGLAPRSGRFTGRHIAAILVAFFGVVIAVNVAMAALANGTFGGLVVENSYVASQHFNRWLDEAEREEALGWSVRSERRADGRLALTGAPLGAEISATARHPLGRLPDQALAFEPAGEGAYLSREVLPAGRWTLRIEVRSAGHLWRTEEAL